MSAKHNQMRDLNDIVAQLALNPDLRNHAGCTTKEMPSPIMRFLQAEEHLKRHRRRG